MKKYTRYVSAMILIILWYSIAVEMNNEFRMPNPIDVFERMLNQLTSPIFYQAVSMTLLRSISGLTIAFVIAISLALLACYKNIIKEILSPIILITKSIPNISYIIIILIWFGREVSAVIITFLILFPMFYTSFLNGFLSLDKRLGNVMKLYRATIWEEVITVRIPLIKPYLKGSLSSGIGLAFKVGVMSEILGQLGNGIGRELQYSRTDLDMIGIFAWTGWIILILIILDWILDCYFEKKLIKK